MKTWNLTIKFSGSFSGVAPSTHNAMRHSNDSPISPSSLPKTPLAKQHHSSAPSPSIPFHKQNHESSRISDSAPASSNPTFPPSSKQQGPSFVLEKFPNR